MSDERESNDGVTWNSGNLESFPIISNQSNDTHPVAESNSKHVISMELAIDIKLGKSKVGDGTYLTGPFAKVNWGKLDDIRIDVKSVLAAVCNVDALDIDVIEGIPDSVGMKRPRFLISLPANVSFERLALCEPALQNYFEFLSAIDAEIPAVLVQPPAEVNETIRKIARDCCERRGGRSLPCAISISSEQFSHAVEATVVVAKIESPITHGDEVPLIGKANGFLGHAQILYFIQDTLVNTKRGLREKKKHHRISFENETFLSNVLAMQHVTETRYVLTVAEYREGKKKWWKLRRIRLVADCLTNAG